MVNNRSKTKKTQNLFKTCFSQEDSDKQSSGSAALIGSNNDLLTQIQNNFMSQASIEDSDEQSTDSGAMIGSNDDLLTEILLRMPVISIFRFKSVSKHWRWLLSDRHFTLRYDKLPKTSGLFVENGLSDKNVYVPYDVENPNPPPFRSLDFYHDPYGIKIVQSCSCLLFCRSAGYVKRVRKYYVFNPTTKQFAIIPSLPGGNKVRGSIVSMSLAFHEKHCVHYKVVCIRKIKPNRDLIQIQIYSSDTGNWKISVESFYAGYRTFDKAVYWNGAIHWYPHLRDHLYFKLEDEQLQALPLPVQVASSRGYHDKEMPTYFGESRGHLHLVTRNPLVNDLRLNVYELSSDYSGWFVKYQVDLDELSVVFPEMILKASNLTNKYFFAIDVVRGEKEDTFIVVKIPNNIIRYNVNDKSFKNIFTFNPRMFGFLQGHRYTERLSSF